ncbi:MAG: DUF1223 domain-containing protein [Devosia sp.]|jgi:hypothetical protein|uniref:DUF1223 domain-containing protein n=1 Tax=Devosia sp. XGJD_8 TaxID=3391187 RepID=UPI001E0D10B8|nr:DUF1223 domain-containing protein [Alphaproteobacteria bacterium]MBU1562054.1 DUF1223 domain-containing protein [Alphaproteobacteria bacterium]MBU2301755.1 DUF1223 domain-containing protein [Alphaproteobacteria bacterium]MBU2369583.1 DUF1223 domain-containing protein [Alphaproteobacteria bacterium]
MTQRPLSGTVLILAALAALALPAAAETTRPRPKAVVELFTSQGCASCPPADALLTSLAAEEDVVALAYHVDYWDYVGWEDTFGSEDYSDRQRAYAKSWGSSRIYTPQMVVNGAKGVVGSRRNEVHGALDGVTLPLPVDIVHDGDMLKIAIPPNTSLDDAVVWLVTYLDRADVAIDTGENAGKSMVYTQVVTGRQALGMWEGESGANLKLPLAEVLDAGSTGIAVIVQQERNGLPGPILGAASFER